MLTVQIILGLLLTLFILIQPGGKGLSKGIGNAGGSFARRGLERLIFRSTFVLLFLFILFSILQFVV